MSSTSEIDQATRRREVTALQTSDKPLPATAISITLIVFARHQVPKQPACGLYTTHSFPRRTVKLCRPRLNVPPISIDAYFD